MSGKKSPSSNSFSKYGPKIMKTPKTRIIGNLHNAWVDYINQRHETPEQTQIDFS